MKSEGQRKMWIIVLILVAIGFLLFWFNPAKLPGRISASINTLHKVELNGSKQWISIRGIDIHRPVLLFLHGGPGSANLALLRQQMPELEQHFVVVNWDQRGAGKSVKPFTKETLSISQMQNDTHELVEYLKVRFHVEKIYLVGFSWGTVLGLTYADEYPEDLYAYIGISQLVDALEGERLSLEHVRQIAQEKNNQKAINELAKIDLAAYTSSTWFEQIQTERKWLLQFGCVYHTRTSYSHEIKSLLTAPEYSLIDFALWPIGSSNSLKQVYLEVLQINFFDSIPRVDVPVYFLAGRYDYNTPFELAERYYGQLDAPAGKQMIWFDDSAHSIPWDEPGKLAQTLIDIEQNISK